MGLRVSLLGSVVLVVAGCSGTTTPARPTRMLDARDFATSAAPTQATGAQAPSPVTAPIPREPMSISPVRVADSPRPIDLPPREISLEAATSGVDPSTVVGQPGGYSIPAAEGPGVVSASQLGQLVEAKVGDINGRPVYASEVLGPLDALLRAEAANQPPEVWRAEAERTIARALDRLIEAEVLRAEATAMFPTERRATGLRMFFENVRADEVRRARGSVTAANLRLEETAGYTLDELVAAVATYQLTQLIIRSRIESRVHISWREIQQEYERRYGEFNPRPMARFRWIRVRDSRPADIEAIEQALDSGMSFIEAASLPANGNRPESGGLFEQTFDGAFEEGTYFLLPEVNSLAVQLGPNEYVGPIQAGGFHHWVMLEEVRQVRTSLYEAQAFIQRERFQEIRDIEVQQFVKRLRERASFTDTREMTSRLMAIAIDRYQGSARSSP
ncbi:MAG: peptidylprolyl isomerase [Phycisphaeraceae bacterium]|nr:peptidylprolyl isomerase [Phycisphaeraceae bacterium]